MKLDVFARFARNRNGNVGMIFGLCAIPLTFAVGMAVDYANNARKWSQLNAAADAAALAAVAQPMLQQSNAAAQTAAQNMFTAQASQISNLVPNSLTSNISVTTSGTQRVVTVDYNAQLYNIFAGVLGQPSTAVSGGAQAGGASSPAVDFYVLADTSPSMALPATSAGVAQLEAANANTIQLGSVQPCAFACHEANPTNNNYDSPANPKDANGNVMDDYAWARSLGIALRIDNLKTGVLSLAATANAAQTTNNTQYRMAIYTFDENLTLVAPLGTPAAAEAAASNIQLLEVYAAGFLTKTSTQNPYEQTTQWYQAMSQMTNVNLPSPGSGTISSPKEFLMIVTDGVEDDASNVGLMTTTFCDSIKNRGISIGVVYTTYFPTPTYYYYNAVIAPIQSQIGPNLASCASSPAYFVEVNLDADIGVALNTIFHNYTAAAHLTQ